MKISFRTRATTPPAELRDRTVERLQAALAQHGPRVRSVSVRLVDVNGPRGGVDLRCRVVANLRGSGQIFAEAASADPFQASDVAVERLARAIARVTAARRTARSGVRAAPVGEPG